MNYTIILVLIIILSSCSGETSFSVELTEEKEKVAQLIEADTVNVVKLNNSIIIATVVSNKAFDMSISERDSLAIKIKDVCLSSSSNVDGVSIVFMSDNISINRAYYNWSIKEGKFVDVIKST